MSFWKYCDKCNAELDPPTHREALTDTYECPHCGMVNDPLTSMQEIVLDLLERVKELEGAAR